MLKYETIINQLWSDKERRYYDPQFKDIIFAWELEARDYLKSHQQGRSSKKTFPLMSKYISDINNSLPNIISTGQLCVKGETLAEVYEYVKRIGYFDNVVDC